MSRDLIRSDEYRGYYDKPQNRRLVQAPNDFIPYPSHFEPYYNGTTSEPCDMLQGFCACGAAHSLSEWEIETAQLSKGDSYTLVVDVEVDDKPPMPEDPVPSWEHPLTDEQLLAVNPSYEKCHKFPTEDWRRHVPVHAMFQWRRYTAEERRSIYKGCLEKTGEAYVL